jgi:hypothetical protein
MNFPLSIPVVADLSCFFALLVRIWYSCDKKILAGSRFDECVVKTSRRILREKEEEETTKGKKGKANGR